MKKEQSYAELLRHPKWQKMRLEILEDADFACQSCGDKNETLHVHHLYYLRDRSPWEYPPESLRCLCKTCHEYYTELNEQIKIKLGEIGLDYLEQVWGYLTGVVSLESSKKEIEILDADVAQGLADCYHLRTVTVMKEAGKRKNRLNGDILSRIGGDDDA